MKRNLTMMGIAALLAADAMKHGIALPESTVKESWGMFYRERPLALKGKPSGAARAKRIARKNRHIRARSAK